MEFKKEVEVEVEEKIEREKKLNGLDRMLICFSFFLVSVALPISNRLRMDASRQGKAPLEPFQRAGAVEERLLGKGEETGRGRGPIDDDETDCIGIARPLLPANAAAIVAGLVPTAETEMRRCISCGEK